MTRKLTHNLTFSIGTFTLKLTGTTLVEDVEPRPEPAAAPKPRKDNKPSSTEALWCAALFKRSPQTEWSDKEIGAYVKHKALLTPENRALLVAYYEAERRKGDDGCHRRDLQTFLNNLPGEVDRATAPKVTTTHNGHRSQPHPDRNAGTLNAGQSAQYRGAGRILPPSQG